jgi:SAM-dependent methyltransferase
MHPVNKMLSLLGLRLSRTGQHVPKDFVKQYNWQLDELRRNSKEFKVFQEFRYDVGSHPQSYIDYECEFATRNLSKRNPTTILDVGSYRIFLLGLLASYKVTTLDVRKRKSSLDNEIVLTSDAKQLNIPSNSFDAIVSLCALEHFGLGRFGDEFDLDADKKAFNEMVRVLKPNGILIFTTTITRSAPSIAFNAHKIYDYKMIRALCEKLELCEETFFSHKMGKFCSLEQVSNLPTVWDVYCGCWIKVKTVIE